MIIFNEVSDHEEYLELMLSEKELKEILKGGMPTSKMNFRGVTLNLGVRLTEELENEKDFDDDDDNYDTRYPVRMLWDV